MSYFDIFNAKPINFGWQPDRRDFRDYLFTPKTQNSTDFVNLSVDCPPIYDQGQLGSCTAAAIAAAVQYNQIKQNKEWNFTPSKLFIYYNERVMIDTVNYDSGAQIRDGIKSVNKQGVCKEELCPYNISKFTKKPSDGCYAEALYHKAVRYERLDNTRLQDLKTCLTNGSPFVFGFMVFSYFVSKEMCKNGILKIPSNREYFLGGHAVLCVGYDDNKQMFLVRNSWGKGWGLRGYFWMPYEYMTNPALVMDCWTINSITSSKY